MTTLTSTTSETTSTGKIDYYQLNESIVDSIDTVLSYFNLDYTQYPNRVACPCPIHKSDKEESLTLFTRGKSGFGNFVCWTNHCEQDVGRGAFNLVKFLLDEKEGRQHTHSEVIQFVEGLTGSQCKYISEENADRRRFIRLVNSMTKKVEKSVHTVSRDYVKSKLSDVPNYYLGRGFSKNVLSEFDVGTCMRQNAEMFMRIVVPVYDESGLYMVGCLGRSLYEECSICGFHHAENSMCPQGKAEEMKASKWKNSNGFHSGHHLYNLWTAAPLARNSQKLIIVEGQGDVWRLWEAGIYNVVGLFGCNLTDSQFDLIETLGVTDIYLALDKDEAGVKGTQRVIDRLSMFYNLHVVDYPSKDIGELPVEQARAIFGAAAQ